MKKYFFILLAYLPFQLALNISSGFDLASGRAFVLILTLVFLGNLFVKKRFFLKFTLLDLCLIGLLFLMTFSILFSDNLNWSFRKLLFLFSLAPVYLLSRNLIKNKKDLLTSLHWVVVSAFLAAALGIIQFCSQFIFGLNRVYVFWSKNIVPIFSGNSFSEAILANPAWLVNISGKTILRASSLFPDPHMFSFYLNLATGLSIALFLSNKKRRLIWFVIFFVLFLANLLTFSRGGYLGIFCAGLFLVIVFFVKSKKLLKILITTLLLVFILITSNINLISDRFFSSFNLREGSNSQRIETWKKSLDVLSDNLFFGTGVGNFPLHIKPNADYREPIYAHSNYIDIALDGGILALFLFLSLIIVSLICFFHLSMQEPFFWGMIFSIVSFSIHSIFDTSLYSISVFPLFLFIISLANIKIKNE